MNNTSTVNTPTNHFHRSHVTILIQVTSLVVLGVLTILGNLASIVTFVKTHSLRKRCHYLLICLSVADCGVGVVTLMNTAFFLAITSITYNRWLDFMDTLTGFASILTLAVISIERFYAVFFPLKHLTTRFKFYTCLSSFPWILATIIASLNYIFPRTRMLYGYGLMVVIATSLCVILFNYISIVFKAMHSHPDAQNANQSLRDRSLIVTLLIVTLSSMVTWLPVNCLSAVLFFCKTCQRPHINVFFAMKFLQFSNSGLNVFIYILRMDKFRKAFLVLFCGKSNLGLRGSEETKMQGRTTMV